MSDKEIQGQRLKTLREDILGLSQRDFGLKLGVSGALIAQIETGKTGISNRLLSAMASRLHANPAWFLEGKDPIIVSPGEAGFERAGVRISPPKPGRPMAGHFEVEGVGFSLIKRYDLSVSAGNGLLAVDEAEKDRLAFSNDWLRKMGIVPELAGLVTVWGDSMFPTIPDGSTVLFHAAEKDIAVPGIYAFTLDGEVFVKRLTASSDLSVVSITADNPSYPAKLLVGPDIEYLRVVGKIRITMATL